MFGNKKRSTPRKRRALITGVTGQDGSYLAEFLLEKGYEVYGVLRSTTRGNVGRISAECFANPDFKLIHADMTDYASLEQAVKIAAPDEIYNLAAQSFVGSSWQYTTHVADVNGMGAVRLLEIARRMLPEVRFYQASTSEMYGVNAGVANEETPFKPRSPYGAAKLFAHSMAVNYRESFGMHVSCGILFNHESPRRGPEFVTQKIIREAKTGKIVLGNLKARRDWGYAPEYVEAMWLMLQQPKGDDYVIATGRTHSVEDFVNEVRKYAPGVTVEVDQSFLRPAEIQSLNADPTKAKEVLGWQAKTPFEDLVRIMWEAV